MVQVPSRLLGTALLTPQQAAPMETTAMAIRVAVAMLGATTRALATLATTTMELATRETTTMAATMLAGAWMALTRLATNARVDFVEMCVLWHLCQAGEVCDVHR